MSMPPIATRKSARSKRPARCKRMIEDLAKIPLEFSPGEAWNYSVATDVIGYLVGKISGKPFEQFLKERIFDPLGMNDTDFSRAADGARRRIRLAACYAADRKGGMTLQDDPANSSFLQPPSFISGGGGLCSTAADYLTFCRALLNGGELGGVTAARPEDAGADDVKSSARRPRPAGNVAIAVQRGDL